MQGNLQIVYAGFADGHGGAAAGVYMSPNQGQVWNLMAGGIGNPLIIDDTTGANTDPATNPTPNGADGRIVLAVPDPTGNAVEDADLLRLALRRRLNAHRRLRRAVHDQGLRRELDQRRHQYGFTSDQRVVPGHPEPDRLQPGVSRPTTSPIPLTPSLTSARATSTCP